MLILYGVSEVVSLVPNITVGEIKKGVHMYLELNGYEVEVDYRGNEVKVVVERIIDENKHVIVQIAGPRKDVLLSKIVDDAVKLVEKYLPA
jgi:hypothetical protein